MQANDHPPIPPGSKFFKEVDGKLYFLVYSPERILHEWIQVEWLLQLPDPEEIRFWRTFIGAVAAEEWRQEGERRLGEHWECYIPARDAINAWRKWAQGEKP